LNSYGQHAPIRCKGVIAMAQSDSEPRYVISIAARIVGIETHTLRYYERLGLVQPYRSGGNIRYYSEIDIEQLRHIKMLMVDLGVNPAGAEVVIRMAQKITEMQQVINELTTELQQVKETRQATRKRDKKRG
jgi:MerR family transcriptional regulator/heat shock protein HspR